MKNKKKVEDPLISRMKRDALELSKRFMRNIKIELNVDLSSKSVIFNVTLYKYQ